MMIVAPRERSLVDALGLGPWLLARAEDTPTLVTSIVGGPAVVLGALQRAGRVVDLAACEAAGGKVCRRATTGTAVWIGRSGLLLTIVLPHVAALETDATPRTLLNRNVRPLLRAFTRAGAKANYFGREWISFEHRPLAMLGYDVTRQGRVLIEVFVGCEESIALPDGLKATEERALDRFMGKTPACLADVFPDERWQNFAEKFVEGVVVTRGASHLVQLDEASRSSRDVPFVTSVNDPVPEGFVVQHVERVPIGYLEGAVHRDEPSRKWFGGDVLVPCWVFDDLAKGTNLAANSVPIDGAKIDDLLRLVAMV